MSERGRISVFPAKAGIHLRRNRPTPAFTVVKAGRPTVPIGVISPPVRDLATILFMQMR